MANLSIDTTLFRVYSAARTQFLREIGCDYSCRDPVAEFAERLVLQQLGGELAPSRVQEGYDLVCPAGRRVQVKYLANPAGRWRNEHTVSFSEELDDYALLILENFGIAALLIFDRRTISRVCAALKKRHPKQESTLQFTQKNFAAIVNKMSEFEAMGVRIFLPPQLEAV